MYLILVNVILLIVGCFMEAIAAMLILIPILVPPALALGIDPIQFGVVVVLNLMIGTITPPVGIVLFVTARVANLPFAAVVRATPFLWPLLAVLVAITFSSADDVVAGDAVAVMAMETVSLANAGRRANACLIGELLSPVVRGCRD